MSDVKVWSISGENLEIFSGEGEEKEIIVLETQAPSFVLKDDFDRVTTLERTAKEAAQESLRHQLMLNQRQIEQIRLMSGKSSQ